jgi:deoxycytidylate deaminase
MYFGNYLYSHYEQYENYPHTIGNYKFLEIFKSLNPKCGSKFHIAVIMKRGKILSYATNQLASRSSGASSRGSQTYIHAEKNVLRNISKKDLRGSSMYVMRLKQLPDGTSQYQYSQPCPECEVLLKKCINKYGLTSVYFTV